MIAPAAFARSYAVGWPAPPPPPPPDGRVLFPITVTLSVRGVSEQGCETVRLESARLLVQLHVTHPSQTSWLVEFKYESVAEDASKVLRRCVAL